MDLYFIAPDAGGNSILVLYEYFTAGVSVDYSFFVAVPTAGQTFEDLRQAAITNEVAYRALHSYTVTNAQRYYPNLVTSTIEGIMSSSDKIKLDALSNLRTTSSISPSLVGTGATGTQVSSTKDSTVLLNVSTSTTSTIGGPSTSVVALKICSTNNATESSWTTVATLENDQTITLAIVLNSIQVMKGQLISDVPAGWYYKLVNSGSGTHTETAITGQQTIYG